MPETSRRKTSPTLILASEIENRHTNAIGDPPGTPKIPLPACRPDSLRSWLAVLACQITGPRCRLVSTWLAEEGKAEGKGLAAGIGKAQKRKLDCAQKLKNGNVINEKPFSAHMVILKQSVEYSLILSRACCVQDLQKLNLVRAGGLK